MSINDKISDYITFPRTFESYAWYKPIIVFILANIVMFIIGGLMLIVGSLIFGFDFVKITFGSGIEGLNSAIPIIFSDLFIFMFVPGLYFASKIVKDRPFSSYASSRGGWNFKLYLKALIIPVILYLIYQGIEIAINGSNGGTYQVSILFLIVLFISVPLQSTAEEFMFRGILLQTLGSWFKIPVLAIVIQAIIFGLAHGYNSFGLFETVVMGLICGFFAWKTDGIEVSSAIHTANNFCVGFFIMLGLHTSTSSPEITSVLPVIVFEILLCVLLYYVGKKTSWFGELPKNSQNS